MSTVFITEAEVMTTKTKKTTKKTITTKKKITKTTINWNTSNIIKKIRISACCIITTFETLPNTTTTPTFPIIVLAIAHILDPTPAV
jgi:hypothetical protein